MYEQGFQRLLHAKDRPWQTPVLVRGRYDDRPGTALWLSRARGGRLNGYDAGLDGFFSSLWRSVKRVVKPVVHIGAAIATGGQSIPVSAAILNAEAQKKEQERLMREQAAMLNTVPPPPVVTTSQPGAGLPTGGVPAPMSETTKLALTAAGAVATTLVISAIAGRRR